jgi:hypothetical protein
MRLKLPRGRVLEGEVLASFEQERERIDSMLARGARLAQTSPAGQFELPTAAADGRSFTQTATARRRPSGVESAQ